MITLEQAKSLSYGTILYHKKQGKIRRWKVNGKVKTWKTRPNEVKIPVKYGLYSYDFVTETELNVVCLNEEDV